MLTYDVYTIYYHGKVSDYHECNYDGNSANLYYELYDFVSEHGEWDLVASYKDYDEAWRMWNDKWSKMAETKLDDDDNDFFSCTMMRFEKTERDENEEPLDSWDLDEEMNFLEM